MILARDRMIAKHPDLRVIGFHLGSMEFDVAEIAKRLDSFPNFAVSTGNTVRHLMKQSREAVRDFFIRYQDRIIYGSDISGGMVPTRYLIDMSKIGQTWTPDEVAIETERLRDTYNSEFSYYATDQEVNVDTYAVRGLALPDTVLRKVFYENAVTWVPGIAEAF